MKKSTLDTLKKFVAAAVIMTVTFVGIVGIVLPGLISAKSTGSVLGGIGLGIAAILGALFVLTKTVIPMFVRVENDDALKDAEKRAPIEGKPING